MIWFDSPKVASNQLELIIIHNRSYLKPTGWDSGNLLEPNIQNIGFDLYLNFIDISINIFI